MDVWKLLGFITHDPDPSKTQMKLICLSSPHFGEGCVCVCVCVCSKKQEGSCHPVLSALAKQCLQGSS